MNMLSMVSLVYHAQFLTLLANLPVKEIPSDFAHFGSRCAAELSAGHWVAILSKPWTGQAEKRQPCINIPCFATEDVHV